MSSLKLSRRLLYSVRFVFVSTFNLQRGTAFVVGNNNLRKQAVCVKVKAPADHVYHRRTWDELKRVLSVAPASQPVERAENLEYRNQLSGMCWGAVYCSSHKDLRSECILLPVEILFGHPVVWKVYETNIMHRLKRIDMAVRYVLKCSWNGRRATLL